MRREITTDTSSSSEHLCELQYEDDEDDDELNSSNNNNRSAGDFKWTDETRVILANVSYLLCYEYTSENKVFYSNA